MTKYNKKIFLSIIISIIITLIFGSPIWDILINNNKIIGFIVALLLFFPITAIPIFRPKPTNKYLLIILLLIIILYFIGNLIIPLSYILMGVIIGMIINLFINNKTKIIFFTIITTLIFSSLFNNIFIKIYEILNMGEVGLFWVLILSPYPYLPFSNLLFPFVAKMLYFMSNNNFFAFFLSLSFFWFFIAYPTLSYFYQKKKLWLRLLLPYILIVLLSFWDNYKFYLVSLALAAVGWFLGWIIVKTGLREKIISLFSVIHN